MSGPSIPGDRITRIIAANGITYGASQRGAAWGSARCPVVPRIYRESYGNLEAPPQLAELVDTSKLAITELGGEIWDRLGVHELPRSLRQTVLDWVGQLYCPYIPDVIPAGVPLSWVAALPLRTRTRNAVLRLAEDNDIDGPLEHPMSSDQLLELPRIGAHTLVDFLCVIESAELHHASERRSSDGPAIRPENSYFSPLEGYLRDLATWAIAETDSVTLGNALSAAAADSKEAEAWPSLATFRLADIAGASPHPYSVFDDWADALSERERPIFSNRIAVPEDPHTLQHLADDLKISRERVRQLEGRILERLHSFVDSATGRPIRWRINTLKRRLGVAAPRDHPADLLAPPDNNKDYRDLLVVLAGPYKLVHGWLVDQYALQTDPTDTIRGLTDEAGRIDLTKASESLTEWGLDISLHEAWLVRDGKIRSINGHFVRWDGPIADKLFFALTDLGTPATAEDLLAHIEESRATTSARNAMAEDDRFVRANRTEWALTAWGLPEYSGIASTIGQILEANDQQMRVDEVVDRMCTDFGIAEGSARAYCDAAMFVVEEGWIRLRHSHEPYQHPDISVRDAAGVFPLGGGRVGLLYEVDRDVVRGSGRQLSPAAGAILGIAVNDRLQFESPSGIAVSVTFPGTSFMGPSLGSTRVLAEATGAKLGDCLTVVLSRDDLSVSATATNLSEHDAGWPLVARLTAIDEDSGMDGLAAALRCTRGEVRATLRARGDHAVLAALPARRSTPDLEVALAELDAEMRGDDPP